MITALLAETILDYGVIGWAIVIGFTCGIFGMIGGLVELIHHPIQKRKVKRNRIEKTRREAQESGAPDDEVRESVEREMKKQSDERKAAQNHVKDAIVDSFKEFDLKDKFDLTDEKNQIKGKLFLVIVALLIFFRMIR